MMSGSQLLLLELNEVNFDFIRRYADAGRLPNLAALIDRHGIVETTSESRYEELEPWIQWVTAHTGLTLEQHRIERLGDILKHDVHQIWEHLEANGCRVGAISPMNAKNRTRDAAFFVPDPWTRTTVSGSAALGWLHAAISQAVNDNAQSRVAAKSALSLLAGMACYAYPAHYPKYVSLALGARRKPWSKALFLDLLLADVFIAETRRKQPHFASLFLNAGAHIQHHYMFNSAAYDGDQRNPDWYVAPGVDPLLDVYRLYDDVVGAVMRGFPAARLMIATGLHQDPHADLTYYWRLRDHDAFLRRLGASFDRVEPRMSRDFVVVCGSEDDARSTAHRLQSVTGDDGTAVFEVDNRGRDLFVMLVYPHDIGPEFGLKVGNERIDRFRDLVAFVAVKNGQHNGVGYLIDTSAKAAAGEILPLAELPQRICDAFGVRWAAA